MILHLIIIFLLFIILVYFSYAAYEGFNSDYPQKNYSPTTSEPFPTALDGSSYVSPDLDGNCPSEFSRDVNDSNSLCHRQCARGKFYNVDKKVYGCVALSTQLPQEKYSSSNYIYTQNKKTNVVSPTATAVCPTNFELDIKSGFCHSKCRENEKFFLHVGCIELNTRYPQSEYDGSNNKYIIADDGLTQIVSSTSSATCPPKFMLDYTSGLCYSQCPDGKKFSGALSGTSVIGCQ